MKFYFQHGFTLIEIAIVLLVVTILLGYTVAMFPIQQELKQYRQVDLEMDEIIQHLIGFAQVNGRLPCPDTSGDIYATGTAGIIDGQEDNDDLIVNATGVAGTDNITDDCKAYSGFLPAGTIGINGDTNVNGSLLDPWGEPYRYHVSDINFASAATTDAVDLVSPNGIREEGLSNVIPDLFICADSNVIGDDDDCDDVTGTEVFGNIAVVLISTGKDRNNVTSNIQLENTDDFHDGTDDRVYIISTRSDVAGSEYDDVLRWISPNVLYSKMIEAGRLP